MSGELICIMINTLGTMLFVLLALRRLDTIIEILNRRNRT